MVAAPRVVVAVAESMLTDVAEIVGAIGVASVAVADEAPWNLAVRAGLEHLANQELPTFLVHDWRHPLVPVEVVDRVIRLLADGHGVVVPVIEMTDSVKAVDTDGTVLATVDRTTLRNVQFPRGFAVTTLFELLAHDTDTLQAALAEGRPVATVAGHADAGRFTLPADAPLLEAVISTR